MDILSDYSEYLRHFTREDYPAAFKKYKAECEKYFAAMTESDTNAEVSKAMAFAEKELSRRLGRKAKCFDLRSFFCVYLCPAAKSLGTETAVSFANTLCEKWNTAQPEFSFEAGTYEDIIAGFRTKPFSF